MTASDKELLKGILHHSRELTAARPELLDSAEYREGWEACHERLKNMLAMAYTMDRHMRIVATRQWGKGTK